MVSVEYFVLCPAVDSSLGLTVQSGLTGTESKTEIYVCVYNTGAQHMWLTRSQDAAR